MLGTLIVGAVAVGLAWKYRDFLRDYVQGAGSAREKTRETIDALLGTVQEKSESLLDQAKDQVSSRIEKAREKVRGGASDAPSSTPGGSGYAKESDRAWTPKS